MTSAGQCGEPALHTARRCHRTSLWSRCASRASNSLPDDAPQANLGCPVHCAQHKTQASLVARSNNADVRATHSSAIEASAPSRTPWSSSSDVAPAASDSAECASMSPSAARRGGGATVCRDYVVTPLIAIGRHTRTHAPQVPNHQRRAPRVHRRHRQNPSTTTRGSQLRQKPLSHAASVGGVRRDLLRHRHHQQKQGRARTHTYTPCESSDVSAVAASPCASWEADPAPAATSAEESDESLCVGTASVGPLAAAAAAAAPLPP